MNGDTYSSRGKVVSNVYCEFFLMNLDSGRSRDYYVSSILAVL